MMRGLASLFTGLAIASTQLALAQSGSLGVPKSVEAGVAFSIQTSGSGKATLYIVGPAQVLKRDVQLGETTFFPAGSLYNAGRYLVVLSRELPTESSSLDVVPASKPADLSFFAKPSRLQVGLHGGITGAVYVFDAYRNLITAPAPVSFELKNQMDTVQARTVTTDDGAAFTEMDSTARQGIDKFVARIGDVSSTRVVDQVPGDPCGLKMSARELGSQLQLQTDPVRDCSGNAVPDGTIVTFSAYYNGAQSTVDVPLKHGIAEVQMRAHSGATISVASGVVLGNQIRWEKQ
jgi:hypothetical protein